MIIGIDLDDVLAKNVEALDQYHNEKYGTNLSLKDHFDYNLSLIWNENTDECARRVFDFLANHSHKVKPQTDSQEILTKLAQKHTFKVITSRPDIVQTQTKEWINNHFSKLDIEVHFAGIYYGSNKKNKSQICHELGVSILIEDCLDIALECAEAGINVLLFDMPWNQRDKLPINIQRVHSWQEIGEILW